jgi:hypothetical protein
MFRGDRAGLGMRRAAGSFELVFGGVGAGAAGGAAAPIPWRGIGGGHAPWRRC